jgi:hypothetical protein
MRLQSLIARGLPKNLDSEFCKLFELAPDELEKLLELVFEVA